MVMTLSEFAAVHEAALETSAARHIMMLGLLAAVRHGRSGDIKTWSLGQPGECAMMRPDGLLLLGDLDQTQCRTVAEALAETRYAGVVGPDESAHWFSARAAELGARFISAMPQRAHSLTQKPHHPGTSGYARRATIGDVGLLNAWMTEFNREATPHEPPPSREQTARGIADGRSFVWIVDDAPVSVAAIARRTRTAGAIARVFTPAPLRMKGYAGSVTAAVAERLFGEGLPMVCLNTDLRNPWSNRCYEKIGFKPVCDLAFYGRAT
jgi:predicted GNAT family acetyltransferase